MTATPDKPSDEQWQTLAAGLFTVAAMVAIGRWWAGATFGYVLFAAVWGPIAAGNFAAGRSHRIGFGITIGIALLFAVPLALGWPIYTAFRLAGLLCALIFAGYALSVISCRWLGRSLGVTVATVTWLTWVIVPLTMSGAMFNGLAERWLEPVSEVHPVVVLNVLDSTAGDWTHQAIAYKWLTRLGQDISFGWPESAWPCIVLHLAGGLALVTSTKFVPRGTPMHARNDVPRGTVSGDAGIVTDVTTAIPPTEHHNDA